MRLSLLSLSVAFATTALTKPLRARQADIRSCVAQVLGEDADERIVVPEDETYTDARIGEHIQDDKLPAMIAFAQHKDEISALVKCATSHGVQPVPRSGGHHFLAYSTLTDSLVIDISHIDHVEVSEDGATAVVGGGIRLGALYTALHLARGGTGDGFDFPGGICPTVGLSGFLSAGGFNMQMRSQGLGVDSVLSAEVVLSSGCHITVFAEENGDLFWAIRGGGGGSYGIVVEWTLNLREYPRAAMTTLSWNATGEGMRAEVANAWHDWAPRTDSALTSQLLIYQHSIEFLGWCIGCSEEKLRSLLAESGLPSLGLPEVHYSGGCSTNAARTVGYLGKECMPDEEADQLAPVALNVQRQPWAPLEGFPSYNWSQELQNPEAPPAQPWNRAIRLASSYFVVKDRIPEGDVFTELIDRLDLLDPESNPIIEWHSWNISHAGDAAFAWRDQAYSHIEIMAWGSEDEEKHAESVGWFDETEAFFRPIVGHASYAGYMDDRISTPPLESYYGENVAALAEIKQKYDRRNLWTNPMAIGAM